MRSVAFDLIALAVASASIGTLVQCREYGVASGLFTMWILFSLLKIEKRP
jgi:hypothetical protein